jgi:hypothetical protein
VWMAVGKLCRAKVDRGCGHTLARCGLSRNKVETVRLIQVREPRGESRPYGRWHSPFESKSHPGACSGNQAQAVGGLGVLNRPEWFRGSVQT